MDNEGIEVVHRSKEDPATERIVKILKDLREMIRLNGYTPSEFLSAVANLIVAQFLESDESTLRIYADSLVEGYRRNKESWKKHHG